MVSVFFNDFWTKKTDIIVIMKSSFVYTSQFGGLLVLVLLSAVGQMLLPAFLAQMISQGVAKESERVIWIFAAIMASVTVFSCIISFLSVKTASVISTDFAAQLREKVFSLEENYLVIVFFGSVVFDFSVIYLFAGICYGKEHLQSYGNSSSGNQ